jgi:hypothetical protein
MSISLEHGELPLQQFEAAFRDRRVLIEPSTLDIDVAVNQAVTFGFRLLTVAG